VTEVKPYTNCFSRIYALNDWPARYCESSWTTSVLSAEYAYIDSHNQARGPRARSIDYAGLCSPPMRQRKSATRLIVAAFSERYCELSLLRWSAVLRSKMCTIRDLSASTIHY